jgi:hypothetical protein
LFKDGPSIMNVKSLEERLNKIEYGQITVTILLFTLPHTESI